MLAKGLPNCIPECSPRWQGLPLRRFDGGTSLFPGFISPTSCRGKLAIRAGGNYSRIPMETPGAYLLVDEETGERVIVWGGADNALDSPLPSKDVLTWKPAEEAANAQGARSAGMTRRRSLGTTGSFGKLKAQKVNALIRNKKSPMDVSDNDDDDDDDDEGVPVSSDTGLDVRMRKRNELIRRKQIQPPRISIDNDGSDDSDDEDYERRPSSRFLEVLQKGERVGRGAKDDERAGRESPVNGWMNVEPSSSWRAAVQPDVQLKTKDQKYSDYDARFFSRKSFKELGCSDEMVECLRKQQFNRPSHIQAMAYSHLLEGRSCIISDQSGSGKTLAYLAPTIQRMRQEEIQGLSKSSSRSPRVLILVPTAELATQVLHNCRSIARSGFPFRSMVATGGFRQKTQLESLEQDLDVLIATPGRFIYLFQEGFLKLNNLKCAVLDEVDILFGDEAFEQLLKTLMVSAPVMTQYQFVTATLPGDIYNKLVGDFPDCEVIAGPGMHRVSYGLEEVLVDCSGNDKQEKNPETAFSNKKSALLQLVEQSPVCKTVIFCNKIETCRKVENVLKRFDRKEQRIKVLPFHAAMEQDSRLSNMKDFMTSTSDGSSLFLVCTDRASRGIDFLGVDHVVLFDFPRDPSEYIRRVGRTARGAGGRGKSFAFVVGKQVSLARRIMDRNIKGHPVHDLPST